MALVLKDRVLESSTSTGTGTFTLTGAQTGYQSFSVIGNGNTVYYTIQGKDANGNLTGEWEVGTGTWSTGNTLSRDTVLESSNANAKVVFSAGSKDVFCDLPAEVAVYQDSLGTVTVPQLAINSVTNTTPSLSFNGSNTNLASGATVSGSYLQSILQNKSGTAGASTNYVLSNDLGTDSTYYGEFGMNSSVYSSGTPADFFSLNNGIYYSGHDGDVSIGSGNGYKTYFAWGTTGDKAHVINASGAIGLNTNITGTTNFGTAGQVLTSAGSSATPTWTSVTASAGGSTTQVQYNNAGALAGSANFTFNGTTVTTANDASISGLTVGKGGGAVATNTAVGLQALNGTNTGNASNVAIGYQALLTNTSAQSSVAVGYRALQNSNASFNVAIGESSLLNNTTGNVNVAVGYWSLTSNTTGFANVAIGAGVAGTGTLQYNTTGNNQVGIGYQALRYNTTASNLTAIGYQALYNNTTNVATLGTITGGSSYTNGTYTGVVMTLSSGSTMVTYPTATIVVAGGAVTSVTITSGGVGAKDTTTVLTAPAASIGGTGSGFSVPVATLASGGQNTALGYQSLLNNSTGSNNVGIGGNAGRGQSPFTNANTTGSNNTYIGYQTVGSAATNTNEMVIGYQAVGLGSNTTVIGNSSTTLTKTFGVYQATTYTVATLPSAATVGVGARAFVTDALAPTFGATVVTGGAVAVPVYSDGSAWKVG